jgi:hypothetical protein
VIQRPNAVVLALPFRESRIHFSISPCPMLFISRRIHLLSCTPTFPSLPHNTILSSTLCPTLALLRLPLPLKIRTRRKERDALIHDRLADPQVVVDPLLDARRLAELVGLYAGTVSLGVSKVLVSGGVALRVDRNAKRRCGGCMRGRIMCGWVYMGGYMRAWRRT